MQRAGWRSTVQGVVNEAEAEMARFVGYINDAVVPEVRRSSAAGLRSAADQLGRLAEQLDRPPARRAPASRFHGQASSRSEF